LVVLDHMEEAKTLLVHQEGLQFQVVVVEVHMHQQQHTRLLVELADQV
jgi:hypothetical protein